MKELNLMEVWKRVKPYLKRQIPAATAFVALLWIYKAWLAPGVINMAYSRWGFGDPNIAGGLSVRVGTCLFVVIAFGSIAAMFFDLYYDHSMGHGKRKKRNLVAGTVVGILLQLLCMYTVYLAIITSTPQLARKLAGLVVFCYSMVGILLYGNFTIVVEEMKKKSNERNWVCLGTGSTLGGIALFAQVYLASFLLILIPTSLGGIRPEKHTIVLKNEALPVLAALQQSASANHLQCQMPALVTKSGGALVPLNNAWILHQTHDSDIIQLDGCAATLPISRSLIASELPVTN